MARGRSRGHKGGRKQFSSADQIKDDLAKQEEKRRWREAHPDSESEESEEEAKPVRRAGGKGGRRQQVEEESSSEQEEESSSEEEDEDAKKKGVQGMIEIENPNRVKQKFKKASALDTPAAPAGEASGASGGAAAKPKAKPEDTKPQLSRREREEIDKAKAKAHYQKMHAAGKTDEARADLARLAIIKKQREEAKEKREAEAKAKEEAAKAKADAKKGGR